MASGRQSLLLCASVWSICAAPAVAREVAFNIPSQPLPSALRAFGMQSGQPLVFTQRITGARVAPCVVGLFEPAAALDRLLEGSGLTHADAAGGFTIVAARRLRPAPPVAAPVERTASPPPPAAPAEVQVVVVTGSRLPGAYPPAPTPLTVVTRSQMEERAPATLAQIIDELPAFRASGPTQSPRTVASITGGQANSNLRALGATRTLTLINGRRQVPSAPSGAIDANRIPVNLVERFEVVTGGASAAYGSDAVAGVVNFILSDRLVGFRASAQYGASRYGDDIEKVFGFAGGIDYAAGRGNVTFGADFSDNDGIGNIFNRPWGQREPGSVQTAINRPAGVPAQIVADNVEYANAAVGSIVVGARTASGAASTALNNIAFQADGTPYRLQLGAVYGGQQMIGSTANYGVCATCHFHLEGAVARANLMSRTRFDLTERLTLTADASYSHMTTRGATSAPVTNGVVVLRSNPYIPAALAAAMDANAITQVTLNRYNTEGDALRAVVNNDTTQFNVGLEGRLGGGWSFDAYAGHGLNRTDLQLPDIPHQPNLAAAAYAVAGPNGTVTCGSLATNPTLSRDPANLKAAAKVLPGCVPFNIFGVPRADDPALNYILQDANSLDRIQQTVLAVNLRGRPFSTWAGPASIAVGAEWRRERFEEISDPISVTSPFIFGNRAATPRSANRVAEAYVELGAPLAKALDFDIALRRTDYRTSGAVTTWKAGLTQEVIPGVRLRATLSRDIRAPNLQELFGVAPVQAINNAFANPFTGQTQVLFSQGGGNRALRPEVAKTFTGGLILRAPTGPLAGASLSVDYYSIAIDNVIGALNPVDIVSRCFLGDSAYCAQITFEPGGAIGIVVADQRNLNHQSTRGVDFDARYRVTAAVLGGAVDLRLLASHLGRLSTTDLFGSRVDAAGTGQALPRWSANLTVNYRRGPLSMSNQFRTFSTMRFSPILFGPDEAGYDPALSTSISKNRYPSVLYWNWSGSYDLPRRGGAKMQAFAAVNNVLDRDPPAFAPIAFALGSYQAYDIIGRRFRLGLRVVY